MANNATGSLREIGHHELRNWSRWCWSGPEPGPAIETECASFERRYHIPVYEPEPGEEYSMHDGEVECLQGQGAGRPLPINHDRARVVDGVYRVLPLVEQRILQSEYTRRHEYRAETRAELAAEASERLGIPLVYYVTALDRAKVAVGRAFA